MSSEAGLKVSRTPSSQTGGWRVWDKAMELAALPVLILLLPFAIVWQVLGKIRYWARRTEIRADYERYKYQMECEARRSLDFLEAHLAQLSALEEAYLTANCSSLAEAEAGYKLLEIARDRLIATAQIEAQRAIF